MLKEIEGVDFVVIKYSDINIAASINYLVRIYKRFDLKVRKVLVRHV